MDTKMRKLKISSITVSRNVSFWDPNNTVSFPVIRIHGKWLRQAGFEIGDEITVSQESNKLIITVNDKKEGA